MNNLVSVIIPTHGGSKVIQRAVDSVLRQTYKNIEIIIVDDNGLDTFEQQNTAAALCQYSNLSNVKYVCHDTNKNGSVARNTGVKNSVGQFISLLDDDDEFYPTKIERLINYFEDLPQDYVLVYGNADGYDGNNIVYSNKAHVPEDPLYDILLHRFSIGTSAFLMRREAYDELNGFDERFKRHQDWEFFARVVANYKIAAVDTPASIRHLTRRHSLKSADTLVKTRLFYLEQMKPYIMKMSDDKQKDVVIYNTLEVIIKYLSEKRFKDFINSYRQLSPGKRGAIFFYHRIVELFKCKFFKE